MKIHELRIGNIVMVDNPKYHPRLDGTPLRVTGFEERVISSRSDHVVRLEHIKQKPDSFYESYSQFLKFIKPIQLTEEILFKCGFYQENGVMSYVTQDYSDIKIIYETLAKYYRLYPYTYRIDYLHQLQNLYFDLTGEELELKL